LAGLNPYLDFLLSSVFDGSGLHPEHLADLRESGLTDETITTHKIRTAPPGMIDQLLGFKAPKVRSAYLIPFPSPQGGWMDHIRLKVFGADDPIEVRGDYVEEHGEHYRYNNGRQKYLVRRRSVPRLYFPIPTMARALEGPEPVWILEGCKKALAAMQLGLPAVGLEGPWSWHLKGERRLLPDFSFLRLKDRTVELVPDSDVSTNPKILRAMRQLADAVRAVGAQPRLVRLPDGQNEKVGLDDYIMTITAEAR
jgi:putative DNA primase/helicase